MKRQVSKVIAGLACLVAVAAKAELQTRVIHKAVPVRNIHIGNCEESSPMGQTIKRIPIKVCKRVDEITQQRNDDGNIFTNTPEEQWKSISQRSYYRVVQEYLVISTAYTTQRANYAPGTLPEDRPDEVLCQQTLQYLKAGGTIDEADCR